MTGTDLPLALAALAAPAAGRTPSRRLRLILADDHQLVLEGLRMLFSRTYEVVGTSCDGESLLALLSRVAADCLVLDLCMEGRNGLELIPAIRHLRPELRILVATMIADRQVAEAALAAGASGFVPKDISPAEFHAAIKDVMGGLPYISPRIPRTTHRVGLEARRRGFDRLTPRQQQIVLRIGEGKSLMDISRELSLSPSTITFHKHNIMRTLGVENDRQLRKFAVLLGNSVQVPAL